MLKFYGTYYNELIHSGSASTVILSKTNGTIGAASKRKV